MVQWRKFAKILLKYKTIAYYFRIFMTINDDFEKRGKKNCNAYWKYS